MAPLWAWSAGEFEGARSKHYRNVVATVGRQRDWTAYRWLGRKGIAESLMSDLYDLPLVVTPIRDGVMVAGPHGLSVAAITPAAALASAELLVDAARVAMSGELPPLEED
jgi:hypothetical protein